jgi:hypothetical protein
MKNIVGLDLFDDIPGGSGVPEVTFVKLYLSFEMFDVFRAAPPTNHAVDVHTSPFETIVSEVAAGKTRDTGD